VPKSSDDPRVQDAPSLQEARRDVRAARQAKKGVFATPLLLEPFELRYLAGRRAPDRWLIDLGAHAPAAKKTLWPPESYFQVPAEDRLWVPSEYVPLFVDKGWTKAAPNARPRPA